MKRILVMGVAGMAGNTINKYLSSLNKYDIITTARNNNYIVPTFILDIETRLPILARIMKDIQPDIVINCIGLLVKQCQDDMAKAIYINSYLPHYLEMLTKNTKTKIIHLSTDCVNNGLKGNYSETDIPNETSNYGRSKALGEIVNDKDLTIRLSIIGNELKKNGTGLFHWFIKQQDKCKGFTRAYWNGITCLELAKQIDKIIDTNLTGLYHLAPDFKISKYNLLQLIAEVFNKDIVIEKDFTTKCDKSLIPSYRRNFQPILPKNYKIMLIEMKNWINKG